MRRALTGLIVLGAVFSPAPMRPQARWTVDAKPVVDIPGTTEKGDVAFGTANWATRLASGTIVVADARAPGLRFFDGTGKRIRSAGCAGQGPGDFLTVTWVSQCAKDTLFAWDFLQSRVTVLDSTGNVARTFPFGARGGSQLISSCNRLGTLVQFGAARRVPPSTPPDPNAGYQILSMVAPIQLVDAIGNVTVTLGEVPVGEFLSGSTGRASFGGMPRPLGRSTSMALSADRLFVGTGDSATVDAYALDGQRVSSLTLRVAVRAPSEGQYERAAQKLLSLMPGQMRETARTWVLGIPMPAKLPPYTGLFSDPDGLVWAVLSVPGDKDTQLRAHRATGQVVADVRVPVNLVVFEIGAGYILGVREDADGEQHVVMYRLHRAR